jgi:hypothetical protein
MSTEVLACPSCRAPGPTGPDARGEYLCIYCGTRFHRTPTPAATGPAVPWPGAGGAPPAVHVSAPAPASSSAAGVLIAVGLLVLLGAGAAFFLLFAPGDVTVGPSGSPASAPVSAPAQLPTPVPTLSPTHTPPSTISSPIVEIAAPEPPPPASATFEFQRTQTAYQTSFYSLGFVVNTSPFVIDKPKIIAVMLDAEGKEVGTDHGYAERDVLAPQERSPVKILVSDPPEHASIRYEVVVREASYIPAQAEGLRIEAVPPRPAKYGDNNWECEGKVHNEGPHSAKFVSVEIQALDGEGKLVGLYTTYADVEVLAPGAAARYSVQVTVADKPDHFEFAVGSRIADP